MFFRNATGNLCKFEGMYRAHSSVGSAVALDATGLGFDSQCFYGYADIL